MSIVGPQGRWNNDGSPEQDSFSYCQPVRPVYYSRGQWVSAPKPIEPDPQDSLRALFATEDGYYPSIVLEPTMRKKPADRRFGSGQ